MTTPCDTSQYRRHVSQAALAGPVEGNASRLPTGAMRDWQYPSIAPSVVLHIAASAKTTK